MEEIKNFPAILPVDHKMSELVVIFFYTLVGSFGSLAYADSVGDSVISSIETKWIQQAVNLMIALHCLTTVTLTINTVNQEVEEWFRIPHGM